MVKPVDYPTFKLIERRKAEIRAIYKANLMKKKGARGHWAKVYSTSQTSVADVIETDDAGHFKADTSKDKEMLTPEFLVVLETKSFDQVATYVKSTFGRETPCSPLKSTGRYGRHRKSQVNKARAGAGDQVAFEDGSDDESYRGSPAGPPLSRNDDRSARERRTIQAIEIRHSTEDVRAAEDVHMAEDAQMAEDAEGSVLECIDLTLEPEDNMNDAQEGNENPVLKLEMAMALQTDALDEILSACNLSMYKESFLEEDAREPQDLIVLRELSEARIKVVLRDIREHSRRGGKNGVGILHLQKFIEVLKEWDFNQ